MTYDFCPGCSYGPEHSPHNGQGLYCKPAETDKKPSRFQRLLSFISGNKENN